jgi:hypothetical protein
MPTKTADPVGYGPHHYATVVAAAKMAGEIFGDVSVKQNAEIGGWIVKDHFGKYGFTRSEVSNEHEHGVDPGLPPGGTVAGWHVHPHKLLLDEKGQPYQFSTTPSPGDIQSYQYWHFKQWFIVSAEDHALHRFDGNGNGTGSWPIGILPPCPSDLEAADVFKGNWHLRY